MTNILVGLTLTGIKIAKDKTALLFETATGEIIARCDADCCSHTWVEHIELPALGFPALVTAAADLDMEKPELDDDGDVIKFYGFKIVTDRGEIVIDYRNSSNGYYGGNLAWPSDDYYGGVFRQMVTNLEWDPVTP